MFISDSFKINYFKYTMYWHRSKWVVLIEKVNYFVHILIIYVDTKLHTSFCGVWVQNS